MVRCIFVILPAIVSLLAWTPQTPTQAGRLPSVSISLPPGVPSKTVQISYFLIGPFGGYRGFVPQRAGVDSYEIPAFMEGKAAREIRMIVFASGCDLQTFVIPLEEKARVHKEFQCRADATVRLSGQIVPNELVADNNAELVVRYMAYWAHGFFGITDGFVTNFRIATIPLGADGMFQVDLPYFSADAAASFSEQRASLQLLVRDRKTLNPIADNLEPDVLELILKDGSLRIQTEYPEGLKFTNGHI